MLVRRAQHLRLLARQQMNLVMVIVVYAALCAELGATPSFPVEPSSWRAIHQCTDSWRLARGVPIVARMLPESY
jgi:hypothetical protein